VYEGWTGGGNGAFNYCCVHVDEHKSQHKQGARNCIGNQVHLWKEVAPEFHCAGIKPVDRWTKGTEKNALKMERIVSEM
jgi:hypothetical protein